MTTTEDTPPVHDQIRAALEAQGITRYQLASMLGYADPSDAYRLVAGKHRPSDKLLQDVADVLGVELVRPAQRFTPRKRRCS